jgi:hypothetical protein
MTISEVDENELPHGEEDEEELNAQMVYRKLDYENYQPMSPC